MAEFAYDVLRYLTGVTIVALAGTSIKLFRDVLLLKKDVALLQQQRAADLIEYASAKAIATTVKQETSGLEQKFDLKVQTVVHELSEQRHSDMAMIKEVVSEIKQTLAELNTTIKFMHPRSNV